MKKVLLFITTYILSIASLLIFSNNTHGSHSPLSVTGISQIQGGTLELSRDQIVFDNSVADTIGSYQDTIQLVNYEGRPLTGLSFDLISYGKVVITPFTLESAFSPDNWIITTTIRRGPVLADGSSLDTIHAVLFSTGSASIVPTAKTIIATFGYFTINIDTLSDTTSIQLQNINGAAVDTLGWPIEVGLNTSDFQRITINDITSISLSISKGWNLVSVPVVPNTFDADTLFPGRSGTIFAYNTTIRDYAAASMLANGNGYWVNYASAGSIAITGSAISGSSVTVTQAGWVLLGSMSNSVNLNTIVTIPDGSITGTAWRYNPLTKDYVTATAINPGEAVWVIVNQACTIAFP